MDLSSVASVFLSIPPKPPALTVRIAAERDFLHLPTTIDWADRCQLSSVFVDTTNTSGATLKCIHDIVASPQTTRFFPVEKRSNADPCSCTRRSLTTSCTSNGVSTRPYCGCEDWQLDGDPYCYTVGDCQESTASSLFVGARWRACAPAPSPPPSAQRCADPLFDDQWHHAMIQTTSAWQESTGAESTVVVVDDGIDVGHADLRVDASSSMGWSADGQPTNDASPISADDAHGTACAGVAASIGQNALGGCGVAYDSTTIGVRLITSGGIFDSNLRDAVLALEPRERHVLSNSWGPYEMTINGPFDTFAGYSQIRSTLDRSGGRGGKGTVLVWAAGNGGIHDNVNNDGYNAHPRTISVTSVGDDGGRTSYSEFGACIDVAAPSNGGWKAITTTDISGGDGYTPTDYTDAFGGTSSAEDERAAAASWA